MARKCEVLTGDSVFDVKNRINEWLACHERVEILFFTCQKVYDKWHAAYILYDDGPLTPPIPAHSWALISKPHYDDPFYIPTPTCGPKPC